MPAIPAPTMHRSALISSVSFDSSGKLNVSIQTDLLWSPVFLISMANLECGFMAESLHTGPGVLWPRTRQIRMYCLQPTGAQLNHRLRHRTRDTAKSWRKIWPIRLRAVERGRSVRCRTYTSGRCADHRIVAVQLTR